MANLTEQQLQELERLYREIDLQHDFEDLIDLYSQLYDLTGTTKRENV